MDKACLVSVIMPVYKVERDIRRSIASVMNQTYPHIELLCINDGTPDTSFEICKELAQQYDNIVLLENDRNRGLEYTRNHGMEEMHGKYCLFVDSDDELDPRAVEYLVDAAEESQSDMVFFNFARVIDGVEHPLSFGEVRDGVYTLGEFADFMLTELSIGVVSCVGSKMYRTDIIKQNALQFSKEYRFNEDIGFFLEYLAFVRTITVLNQPFYKYLIRTVGSLMTSYRPHMFSTVSKARELIRRIGMEHGTWGMPQQVAYHKEMLGLMLNSLLNEVKFGDKQSFAEAVNTVREYPYFEETTTCLKQHGALSSIRRVAVWLLEHNHLHSLWWLISVWQRRG